MEDEPDLVARYRARNVMATLRILRRASQIPRTKEAREQIMVEVRRQQRRLVAIRKQRRQLPRMAGV